MNAFRTTLTATLLHGLASCSPSQEDIANGDDPIAALGATVESSRYGQKFWQQEKTAASSTWSAAIEYCTPAGRADFPNCKTVNLVKFLGAPGEVKNPAESEEGFRF